MYTIEDMEPVEGFITVGGECCGFAAWIWEEKIHTNLTDCECRITWKVPPFPIAVLEAALARITPDEMKFDDVGEVAFPVVEEIVLRFFDDERLADGRYRPFLDAE